MPKYGLNKYATFKYGRYKLSGGGGGGSHVLGPHVRYRIRTIDSSGTKSEFLTMHKDRVSIPSDYNVRTRIRANNGEWVYTQHTVIEDDAVKVRIRSIEEDGATSPWIYGDRGILRR